MTPVRTANVDLSRLVWLGATCAMALCVITLSLVSCKSSPVATTPGTTTPESEPTIRVRIARDIHEVRVASAAAPTAPLLIRAQGQASRRVTGPVRVSITGSGPATAIEITENRPVGQVLLRSSLPISIASDGQDGFNLDDRLFPGSARILAGKETLSVIALVPTETYVAGVIASELYPSWSLGAYQVQAVCARSYVLHSRLRALRAGRSYDVESTTIDQAFAGATDRVVAWEGVRSTRGHVLKWHGAILRTYYSSTCGGRTASAADVWPTSTGYDFNLAAPLQSTPRDHACQDSPRYRWEVTRDRDALVERWKAYGKNHGLRIARLSGVRSVVVNERNAQERPKSYRITDQRGQRFTINAEHLRVACNTNAPGLPDITRDTRVSSGDLNVDLRGNRVTISGQGFGHGVGMCQFCAQGFAQEGADWRSQLITFYPGASIDRLY